MARTKSLKPKIYEFHDFLTFLRALIAYLKSVDSAFTTRSFAQKAGIANGYISMCLSGRRRFSTKAYLKIRPHLPLSVREKKYLDILRLASETEDSQTRIIAMNDLQRIKAFKESNAAEHEVHHYLTTWLHLAIREMVNEKNFKADLAYIQSRLVRRVGQAEIKKSLEFLIDKNFVAREGNKFSIQNKPLNCERSIYSLSLAEFHRQMLKIIIASIDEIPRDERLILGHTTALTVKNFELAKGHIQEALEKIEQLSQLETKGDKVFHFEFAAVPLTKGLANETK